MQYPKIETLYARDPDTFKVLEGQLCQPEFGLINQWLVTEKIDGTNIRVQLTSSCQGDCSDCGSTGACTVEPRVLLRGRTDNAQMPVFLLKELQRLFPGGKVVAAFDPGTEVILFGEGYGAKIQKGGGDYREGVSFRLFDVVVLGRDNNPWWLDWENVSDIAKKLEIETVPVLSEGATLATAASLVTRPSNVALNEKIIPGKLALNSARSQEGIVARTNPPLFDKRGHRLVWKLKENDL